MLLRMCKLSTDSHYTMSDPEIPLCYYNILSTSGRLPRLGTIISPQIFIYIFCFHSLQIQNVHELGHADALRPRLICIFQSTGLAALL